MPSISCSEAEGAALPKHIDDVYLADKSGAQFYLGAHVEISELADITVPNLTLDPTVFAPKPAIVTCKVSTLAPLPPVHPHNRAIHRDRAATA